MILEGKVMCKYYPKALCLRDDTGRCGECPYYKVYLREDSKREGCACVNV